jgi:outer membrane protein TolC
MRTRFNHLKSAGIAAGVATAFLGGAANLVAVAPSQSEVAPTANLRAILAAVERDNPTLKSARAKWESMKLRIPQARAWEDPMVGVDVQRMGTTDFFKFTDNEWMASQQIPVSGKNLSRGRVAEAEAKASYEDFRRAHLDVISKTRIAYFRLANAYAQVEINARNKALLSQMAAISRVKYESGTQSQSDVLLAQTDLVRLNETRANLDRDLVEQQSALNVLMNRPSSAPLGQPAPLAYVPFEMDRDRLEALAGGNRPEIAQAESRAQSARAQLQLARRQWIPDPQLQIKARQFNGGSKAIQEYDTGIFFSVPWVNYRKYSAGVSEAQKAIESAVEDKNGASAEMRGMVRDQLQKIQTAAKNYLLFKDSILPLARQTVDVTRAGYEADKSGFLDLITARRTLQDVESAMTEQLANHNIAVAELEAIVGGLQSKSRLRATRSSKD